MRVVWAKGAVDRLEPCRFGGDRPGLDAGAAAEWAVAHLQERVGGLGGMIVLDAAGRVGYAYNTPRMAYAYWVEGMEGAVFGI
jgi:beta-aspartyl-peptidase (threonine type)